MNIIASICMVPIALLIMAASAVVVIFSLCFMLLMAPLALLFGKVTINGKEI